MSFENDIAKLNEHFFFQEFTFSKNQFSPVPGNEVELADNLIWLDEMIIVFQLKERNVSGDSTVEAERKWFEKKVLGVATGQITDTLTYLNSSHQIDVENHRGHRFLLISSNVSTVHKVVCYATVHELPDECRRKKFHISSTAGVIHLFSAHDYLGIVQTLLTPSELSEYLDFREELINRLTQFYDISGTPMTVIFDDIDPAQDEDEEPGEPPEVQIVFTQKRAGPEQTIERAGSGTGRELSILSGMTLPFRSTAVIRSL